MGFFAFTACNLSAICWGIQRLDISEEIKATKERVAEQQKLYNEDLYQYSLLENTESTNDMEMNAKNCNEVDNHHSNIYRNKNTDINKINMFIVASSLLAILTMVSFVSEL